MKYAPQIKKRFSVWMINILILKHYNLIFFLNGHYLFFYYQLYYSLVSLRVPFSYDTRQRFQNAASKKIIISKNGRLLYHFPQDMIFARNESSAVHFNYISVLQIYRYQHKHVIRSSNLMNQKKPTKYVDVDGSIQFLLFPSGSTVSYVLYHLNI